MGLREFWTNVRQAVRLVAPRATVDSPRLDPAAIEGILRSAAFWLTPKAVEGFDANDYGFLSAEQRERLVGAVNGFRAVATQVPSAEAATNQQIEEALPQLLRIFEIVRPDKYIDPDAFVIGKQVEQRLAEHFPSSVSELRFETGEDATGSPALWIWAVLKDSAAGKDLFSSNVSFVRELLERTVSELRAPYWPYVRFRTDAELQSLGESAKK